MFVSFLLVKSGCDGVNSPVSSMFPTTTSPKGRRAPAVRDSRGAGFKSRAPTDFEFRTPCPGHWAVRPILRGTFAGFRVILLPRRLLEADPRSAYFRGGRFS